MEGICRALTVPAAMIGDDFEEEWNMIRRWRSELRIEANKRSYARLRGWVPFGESIDFKRDRTSYRFNTLIGGHPGNVFSERE